MSFYCGQVGYKSPILQCLGRQVAGRQTADQGGRQADPGEHKVSLSVFSFFLLIIFGFSAPVTVRDQRGRKIITKQASRAEAHTIHLKYDCDDKLLGCRDTNLPVVAAIDCGTPWKIDSIAPQIGQNVMNFSDKVVIRESNKTIP